MSTAERSFSDNESPDTRVAKLAANQFGLVRTDQLRASGLTQPAISRRVAAGALERVLPRIYRHPGSPRSWDQRVMAVQLWAGEEAVLSHETAAALWGLGGERRGATIWVTSPVSLRPPQPWIKVRRAALERRDRGRCTGRPVTSPSRTLLDLGSCADERRLEDAVETALRAGLTSIRRLGWQLDVSGGKGVRGSSALRRILEEREPDYLPTGSALELRFRRMLKNHGFPQPSQQHVVVRVSGKRASVDFCYPDLDLAIELDGYGFHGSKTRWNEDLRRQNDLVMDGWRVLRFTWPDLLHREADVVGHLRSFFPTQLSLSESPAATKR